MTVEVESELTRDWPPLARAVNDAGKKLKAKYGDKIPRQAIREEACNLGPFKEDSVIPSDYCPTIHARLALNRNDASKAIEVLQTATPFELGTPATNFNFVSMFPVYIRGQVYLSAHQGSEAAAEFQKILDHRGVVVNEPIGALAHLGLARAYALQGDTAKAKAAYQDFLTLWEEADPDLPILISAKSEYSKLEQF